MTKIEFGIRKKFENFAPTNFFYIIPSETQNFSPNQKRHLKEDDPTTNSCQGKKAFVTWPKTIRLQIFLTASLNFGDIWENLFGEKKNNSC